MRRGTRGAFVLISLLGSLFGQSTEPVRADDLLHKAVALAREQQYNQAKSLLEQGRKLFPKDKRFPVELAGLAYRTKDFSSAKRDLHAALKLDPADAYANDFLGTLYFQDDNLPAALPYWNRIEKPILQDVAFAPMPDINPVLRDRAFDFSGGQVLTDTRIQQTTANLERLDLFSDVRYGLTAAADDRFDLVVQDVPETFGLAAWWGRFLPWLRELPYQGIAPQFLNMGGKAENLRALIRWDPNKRRATLTFAKPWRNNPRFEENVFSDFRDEIWNVPGVADHFHLRRGEAAADLAIGLSPKLQWTLGASVTDRTYSMTPPESLFRSGATASINDRFDYLTWADPDKRIKVKTFAILNAGRFFGNDSSRLVTTRAGLDGTWRPGAKGDAWQVREQAQTGRIFGNIPIDEMFMLSAERDNDPNLWLRGYAGTLSGKKGSGPIGRAYTISQTDLRRRLLEIPFLAIEAGPFFDAGSVHDPSGSLGPRGVLKDAGLEADVTTISGMKLTVVYGHDLNSGGNVFYTAVYPQLIRRKRQSQ